MFEGAAKVGGETQAYCTTCKAMNEHVIIAMVGTRPARVECASCHKQHNYRAALPGSGLSGPRSSSVGRPSPAPLPPPVDLEALIAGRSPVRYDPDQRFAVGDVVGHSSFGTGVVTTLLGPQKIEVAFRAGPRVLVHDRSSWRQSSAERLAPPRRLSPQELAAPMPPSDAAPRPPLDPAAEAAGGEDPDGPDR